MGDPRNPKRLDDVWNPVRLLVLEREIRALPHVVVSGGWAWHFMSPPHEEKKILHDHKDIDLFVQPEHVAELMVVLKDREYHGTWTRFDKFSDGSFRRYEKRVDEQGESVKVIIDLFIAADLASRPVNGVQVLEPENLLSLYRQKKHTTDDCTAVFRARELVARGVDPVGHSDLVRGHL